MSLTNVQIEDLAKKMKIPLEFVGYKDELLFMKPKMNKVYIINLEDEFDSNGNKNPGTHWQAGFTKQDANGKPQYFFFDSYGCQAPKAVQEFIGMEQIPYNRKDIQGLLSSNCGYFCLALGHYLYSWEHRTEDLYTDADNFLDLFQDMNNNMDFYVNEFISRHFFQDTDPTKRIPLKNLHAITELSEEKLKSLGGSK